MRLDRISVQAPTRTALSLVWSALYPMTPKRAFRIASHEETCRAERFFGSTDGQRAPARTLPTAHPALRCVRATYRTQQLCSRPIDVQAHRNSDQNMHE